MGLFLFIMGFGVRKKLGKKTSEVPSIVIRKPWPASQVKNIFTFDPWAKACRQRRSSEAMEMKFELVPLAAVDRGSFVE